MSQKTVVNENKVVNQSLHAQLEAHIAVFNASAPLLEQVVEAAEQLVATLNGGNKILLAGNGGSAADAQHIAAELTGRYLRTRKGLPAIALTTDTSAITAIGNDFGFDQIFARQVEALAVSGDALIVYSTSGNSANILEAVKLAKIAGCKTIALTGQKGGQLKDEADICFCVPSGETPRIQEVHAFLGHAICDLIDQQFTA